MVEIAQYIRHDGMEFDCEVGSASFKVFEKDAGFTRVDAAAKAEEPSAAEPEEPAKKPRRAKK